MCGTLREEKRNETVVRVLSSMRLYSIEHKDKSLLVQGVNVMNISKGDDNISPTTKERQYQSTGKNTNDQAAPRDGFPLFARSSSTTHS